MSEPIFCGLHVGPAKRAVSELLLQVATVLLPPFRQGPFRGRRFSHRLADTLYANTDGPSFGTVSGYESFVLGQSSLRKPLPIL
jgi:hypothetical protein